MSIKRSLWWYRLALWVYPRDFRRRFGAEMEAAFAATYAMAKRRGRGSVMLLWIRTIVEIVAFAVSEWHDRIWSRAKNGSNRVKSRSLTHSKPREHFMSFVHDLRIGARALARRPTFTITAVLTLALGIGANTAVFSVVHGILWQPLAYDSPDELVALWPNRSFSTREIIFLRDNSAALEGVATVAGWSVALTDVAQPTQLGGARTSANVFRVLGITPAVGRTFVDEDVAVGAAPVVMLSHVLWTTQFGSDSSLIGGSITIDGDSHEVIGVMPQSFEIFSPTTALWIPLVEDPNRWQYTANVSRAFARLTPGVGITAADSEFRQLLNRMREEFSYGDDFAVDATLTGLKEQLVGRFRTMFLVLLGAVGFLLLIAGSNLSNLLLTAVVYRRRDFAVRAALGATRGRLFQVAFAESTLLSAAGAIAGLCLAFGGVVVLKALLPESTPRAVNIGVDLPVLMACLAFAATTGLFFGVTPALTLTRTNIQRDVTGARTSGQSGTSSNRLRHGFVVLQIALAVMLVAGAGLMIRSIRELAGVHPGFEYDRVLTMRMFPVGSRYDTPPEYRQFYSDLVERLEAIPSVESVGAVQHLPLSGTEWGTPVVIEGRPTAPGQTPPTVGWRIVAGRYFESMRIRLLEGRLLTPRDDASSPPVAVVNRRFARQFWPEASAVGLRFRHGRGSETLVTVVGVIDNVSHNGLGQEPQPELYRPHLQSTMPAMMLAIRTDGEPARFARELQDAVWSVDANLPISNVVPMADLVTRSYGNTHLVMTLLTVFGGVALALGAIGVYGVTTYAVTQRINEIGLRMALGASDARVRREIVTIGVRNAAAGVAVGVAGALALTRFLETLVFGISATDPLTFGAVIACIACVAVVASYLPAQRATRIDPARALRKA